MFSLSIPIFCINVKNNIHRWEEMNTRFKFFGLNVIQWEATIPSDLSSSPYTCNPELKPTIKSCAISHYRIWEHMLRENIPKALILEDDACFRKDWMEIINPVLEKIDVLDTRWDCLLLNGLEECSPLNTWVRTMENMGGAGYILSIRGAEFMVEYFKNGLIPADGMTVTLQRRGHSYCFFPWLVIQKGDNSDLQTLTHLEADKNKVDRLLNKYGYDRSNYI